MIKKTKKYIIVLIFIVLIILILNILSKNKHSRDKVIELVANSITPNNVYIENNIYENDFYYNCGFAKFYINDNIEYIYQENKNQEKIETYINNENNVFITILHSEKVITQNNNDIDNFELPLKNNILDKLNNFSQYKYSYCGKEKLNEINCIKISLIDIKNNQNFNYYIDEHSGYIVQYEFFNSSNTKQIETYKYSINSVTEDQLNIFNLDNYSDYTFINGI